MAHISVELSILLKINTPWTLNQAGVSSIRPILLFLSGMEGKIKKLQISAQQAPGVPALSAGLSRSHQSAVPSCFAVQLRDCSV